jgi:hypothetical protein
VQVKTDRGYLKKAFANQKRKAKEILKQWLHDVEMLNAFKTKTKQP